MKKIFACIALSITGCSTTYNVTSTPSGAEVYVRNTAQGITPASVKFSNMWGKDSNINIRKNGYNAMSQISNSDSKNIHFDLVPIKKILEITEPNTFVRTLEPAWASIQLKEKDTYLQSWNSVLDIFVRKFDIAIMEKDSGYIRTNWVYTSTGKLRGDYRVRVTAKFNPERTKVDIKTEASYQLNNGWVQGSDTALLGTLKADIMGSVGRITR